MFLLSIFLQNQFFQVIDLIDNLLKLNPAERLTSEQSLKHASLVGFHDPDDEPCGVKFNDTFEKETDYKVCDLRGRNLCSYSYILNKPRN